MKTCISILFLAILLNGCNSNNNLSEKEIETIKAEVIEAMHKAFEHEKSLNAEKTLELYVNNADLVFGGDGYLTNDFNELSNGFKQFTESSLKWLEGNIHKEYVYVISKDAASYSFDYDWKVLQKNGDTLVCKNGAWTFVLRKINDNWQSVHSNGTHIFE